MLAAMRTRAAHSLKTTGRSAAAIVYQQGGANGLHFFDASKHVVGPKVDTKLKGASHGEVDIPVGMKDRPSPRNSGRLSDPTQDIANPFPRELPGPQFVHATFRPCVTRSPSPPSRLSVRAPPPRPIFRHPLSSPFVRAFCPTPRRGVTTSHARGPGDKRVRQSRYGQLAARLNSSQLVHNRLRIISAGGPAGH